MAWFKRYWLKFIWQWLLPTMLKIPLSRKLVMRIYTKTLVNIVTSSVKNYQEVISTNNSLFDTLPMMKGIMATMALMPAAMIYGYLKNELD
jgi:hypothetical protein